MAIIPVLSVMAALYCLTLLLFLYLSIVWQKPWIFLIWLGLGAYSVAAIVIWYGAKTTI